MSTDLMPLLANVFFRAGYVEVWGRCIDKINEECRKHGIPKPDYDFELSGLMLTFRANLAHIESAGSQIAGLIKTSEKTVEKIIEAIQQNSKITIAELSTQIGVTPRSIERNIQKLQEQKSLIRVGSDKGGHWEVIKK